MLRFPQNAVPSVQRRSLCDRRSVHAPPSLVHALHMSHAHCLCSSGHLYTSLHGHPQLQTQHFNPRQGASRSPSTPHCSGCVVRPSELFFVSTLLRSRFSVQKVTMHLGHARLKSRGRQVWKSSIGASAPHLSSYQLRATSTLSSQRGCSDVLTSATVSCLSLASALHGPRDARLSTASRRPIPHLLILSCLAYRFITLIDATAFAA